MARPRKKTEEETPRVEEAEATEELVSEQTPEEAPEAEASEAEAPVEEPSAEAEPEAAAEPATEAPAAPAAPAKPKRVRRPKDDRRARTRVRKARRARASDGTRKPIVRLPKPEHERGRRKERRGVVVSNAMDKTVVVRVDTAKPHRRYKKVVRLSQRIHAHDERNEANVGDVVRIVETRPLSKTKRWRLAEVVEQAR